MIQSNSSSSFNSLSQNILFYHSTTNLFKPYVWAWEHAKSPTVLHCTTMQKYGLGAEQQKSCTQQTENVAVIGFLTFLKQQVSENTRLFPDGHKEQLDCFNCTLLTWNNTTQRANFRIE